MLTTRSASRGRIAVAVAGMVALAAATLGQSVDTAAQATDVARANSSFSAAANFWPTPVVPSTSCSPAVSWITDPQISWTSPGTTPNGGRYRYYVTIHRDNNPNEMEIIGYVTGTSVEISRTSSRVNKGWHARVRTVNGPKISSGYRAEGFTLTRPLLTTWARCTGSQLHEPNDLQQDSSAPALQIAPSQVEAGTEEPTPSRRAVDDGLTSATASTRSSPDGTTTLPSTSAAASSTSVRTSSSPSSTRTTPGGTSTEPSATTALVTRTAPSTTTVAVPTGESSVALPGGGEAEIIGGTTLVVSDGEAPVCTAPVRPGSALRLRSGVLGVVDDEETRIVDLGTCELT